MKNLFLFNRGKYFHLQYFDEFESKKKRVSTGCTTKSEAIKFLIEFEKKLESNTELLPKSLADFSIEYVNFIRQNLSRKYLEDVEITFRQLGEFVGNILLKNISTELIEDFIIESSKKSKFTAKHHYNNLRSAFNKAINWGYLEINPMKKITPPKIPVNNPLFLNETEFKLILSNEQNDTLRDVYLFAFHTGMRLGEIVNAKWNQVSLSERIIRVANTEDFTTKGKKERVVPINGTLFNMLQSRIPKIISLQKTDLIFTKNGFKFNGDYISRKFKKTLISSGINPKIHFHDLRHSFASNLVKKGVSIFIIKELLGHRDIKTTQIYSHLSIDSLKDAVKVLES
jgi:site-specific recombinase XerD